MLQMQIVYRIARQAQLWIDQQIDPAFLSALRLLQDGCKVESHIRRVHCRGRGRDPNKAVVMHVEEGMVFAALTARAR